MNSFESLNVPRAQISIQEQTLGIINSKRINTDQLLSDINTTAQRVLGIIMSGTILAAGSAMVLASGLTDSSDYGNRLIALVWGGAAMSGAIPFVGNYLRPGKSNQIEFKDIKGEILPKPQPEM